MHQQKTKGEVNRTVLVIIALILAAALVFLVVFFLIIKKQSRLPADYSQYLEDLKRQGAPAGPAAPGAEQKLPEILTFSGRLVSITAGVAGENLNLKEVGTEKSLRFSLPAVAAITYGGRSLKKSDLHAGDELIIRAEKKADGELAILDIIVVLSTSPTVPTPINVPPETPGVILPPSKRNIL